MARHTPGGGDGALPPETTDPRVEGFLSGLDRLGFAEGGAPERRRAVAAFSGWVKGRGLSLWALDEARVAEYLARPDGPAKTIVARQEPLLRRFLRHLRDEGVTRERSTRIERTPAAVVERGYVTYLREERGLSERSVAVYSFFVRAFLAGRADTAGHAFPGALDAQGVRAFLLTRTDGRSASYAHLLASSLRSFMRFLFLRRKTRTDLSLAVPAVRMRSPFLPSFLSPEEVERVLATPDRSTVTGRRDHAVLLLLARLGLRAGEVASLELGDVRWHAGEIVVRGKGRSMNHLPLPSDVGQAIALYLRRDRGSAASRHVFLRRIAPRTGLAGPAAVGHIVRLALSRAGLQRPSRRGAAHLFRHGLATRMVRHGASMPEIAEVLGHRSPSTTERYAQVAFEALREVARQWPTDGGAR